MHSSGDVPQSDDVLSFNPERINAVANANPSFDAHDVTHPGKTQAYGVLVLVDPASRRITAVSDNVEALFPQTSTHLLQQSLDTLLSTDELEPILKWAAEPPLKRRSLTVSTRSLSLSVHSTAQGWICEFEPLYEPPAYPQRLEQFRITLDQIRGADTVQELLDLAVEHCCHLTGYERGLAFRFDTQGTGEVLAEVKPIDAIAYKGLHFPASEIPSSVRHIYTHGTIRYVPDAHMPARALVTGNVDMPPKAIDLSQAFLRSIDHDCRQFHQTLGAEAWIVIPLVVEQQLWGLITLQHSQPLQLSLPHRDLLELLGQSLGLGLTNCLKAEALAYETQLKQIQSDLIQAFSESSKFEEVLLQPNLQLINLVQADGVALCLNHGITLMGETPDGADVIELLAWAQTQVSDVIYSTHQLSQAYEPAKHYCDKAAGVLLLRISEQQQISILWFRAEQIQHIRWAAQADSRPQVKTSGNLSPRHAFEPWQESIRCTSKPWLKSEIETARGLRAAISGIALRRADELTRINQELEQSNEELASFAYAASHDLKEPLRGIYNYTTFLIEDYADSLDDAGIERMQALLKLTKRMDRLIDALLKFAQMRQADLTLRKIDLQKLLDSVVELIRISRNDEVFNVHYPRSLPTVTGDSVLLHELFSNLLSNAIKYNDSKPKIIEIGFLTPEEQISVTRLPLRKQNNRLLLYVRDNGIGIKPRHQKSIFRLFKRLHARNRYGGGTGAGLTIVKKIIERHGGEIAVESTYGAGTTFWFSLS